MLFFKSSSLRGPFSRPWNLLSSFKWWNLYFINIFLTFAQIYWYLDYCKFDWKEFLSTIPLKWSFQSERSYRRYCRVGFHTLSLTLYLMFPTKWSLVPHIKYTGVWEPSQPVPRKQDITWQESFTSCPPWWFFLFLHLTPQNGQVFRHPTMFCLTEVLINLYKSTLSSSVVTEVSISSICVLWKAGSSKHVLMRRSIYLSVKFDFWSNWYFDFIARIRSVSAFYSVFICSVFNFFKDAIS